MEGLLRLPSASIEARIAYTEDFFRKLNFAQAEHTLGDQPTADFQCECWQEGCNDRLSLSVEEWALVRAQGNRFAVAPHHVASRFEAAVSTHPSFWIVEKFGEAGGIADELAKLERVVGAGWGGHS
jgi:hypothetical protein